MQVTRLLLAAVLATSLQEADEAGKFWNIVDRVSKATKGGTVGYDEVVAFWSKEKEGDIQLFCEGLQKRFVESNRWDLLAVGAILGGYINHEWSRTYRVWLVLQGREVYEKALKEPASLARHASADRVALLRMSSLISGLLDGAHPDRSAWQPFEAAAETVLERGRGRTARGGGWRRGPGL